ncbi:MAG: hypothetical protein AVDCRST_MAG69-1403 [uncultured Solirubrobacteraceae bacterium]|uniref:FlgN family protein n=1 Tax=uncultured Solirubrobacteraceae bacterium TaxID=1162706 RepID=A0A6J4S8J9_9ACTN|nr:MAG: hypothetical protein AVDCRST_MAG69-1403 [uncultured Solirubrobacteraceae bacterium]
MMSYSVLEAELLAHLDTQIASAGRLLALVLEQGAAIRSKDVEAVLDRLAGIQTEMGRRGQLEAERMRLLTSAGQALGLPPSQVTLESLCALVTPAAAQLARTRSAELRGLLGEIAREHGINRALMRQELAFLSHLVRLVGNEHEGGYRPGGEAGGDGGTSAPAARSIRSMLDLQA